MSDFDKKLDGWTLAVAAQNTLLVGVSKKLDALLLGDQEGQRRFEADRERWLKHIERGERLFDGAESLSAKLDALDAKLRAIGDGLADEMRKLAECIASLPYRKVPNAYRRKSKPLCGRCGKTFRACKCRVFRARKP